MQYKGTTKRISEIAQELGAGYILEGTVRRDGNQVRITAQLIEAGQDRHVWAHAFDREMTGIFQIQSDIAARIAEALQATLSSEDRSRIAQGGTGNISAYDLYLRGREYLLRPGNERGDIDAAAALFHGAIQLDQRYARAWAGVSAAVLRSVQPYKLRRDSALAFARRAVALDAELDEARIALAGALALAGDAASSAREYERALQLNSNSADAMTGLGSLSEQQGRLAEALDWYERAAKADPSNGYYHNTMGWLFLRMGDSHKAEQAFRRHLRLVPDAPGSRANIAVISLLRGDTTSADKEISILLSAAAGRIHTLRSAAIYAIRRGDYERAKDLLQQHAARSPEEAVWPALAYCSYRLGNREEVDSYLRRALAMPDAGGAGRVGVYAWDEAGQLMYRQAEFAALRGDLAGATKLLRDLYDRGWRDYWLLANGYDSRLASGLLADLLKTHPGFQQLIDIMRRDLDAVRANLSSQQR